jgi:cytoskeletal protein RodZ
VSIGAVLADARWRSHLTVSEVSRETRIREAIIWGIEKDDFTACGGDAYARGHIRAIARIR